MDRQGNSIDPRYSIFCYILSGTIQESVSSPSFMSFFYGSQPYVVPRLSYIPKPYVIGDGWLDYHHYEIYDCVQNRVDVKLSMELLSHPRIQFLQYLMLPCDLCLSQSVLPLICLLNLTSTRHLGNLGTHFSCNPIVHIYTRPIKQRLKIGDKPYLRAHNGRIQLFMLVK